MSAPVASAASSRCRWIPTRWGCCSATDASRPSTTPSFSTGDPELALALEMALEGIELVHKDRFDYVLRHAAGGRGGVIVANPVTAALRVLGLAGARSATKFVPERLPVELRRRAAGGAAGSCSTPTAVRSRRLAVSCRVQYTTTSGRLRDDVMFLVRSLGGVAYARTRVGARARPRVGRGGRARALTAPTPYVLDIRLPAEHRPVPTHPQGGHVRRDRRRRATDAVHAIGSSRPVRPRRCASRWPPRTRST